MQSSHMTTVLIIACDSRLGGIYARRFASAGFDAHDADHIDEGMRMAARLKPSLIVLDTACLNDPTDITKKITSQPVHVGTKIILLEADPSRESVKAAERYANAHFVIGHFTPQELVKRAKQLLAA